MNKSRSLKDSFEIHRKRIRDMFRVFPAQTTFLALLLCVLSLQNYFVIMLVRTITNIVNDVISKPDNADLSKAFMQIALYLVGIIALQGINWLKEHRQEKLSLAGRQHESMTLTRKRSRLKYEYFENRELNDKIDLAQYTEFQYMKPLNMAASMFSGVLTLCIYAATLAEAHWLFVPVIPILGAGSFLLTRIVQTKIHEIFRQESAVFRERWSMLMMLGDKKAQSDMQTNRGFFFWRDYLDERNGKAIRLRIKNGLIQGAFGILPSLFMAVVFLGGIFYITGRIFNDGSLDIGFFTMYISVMVSVVHLVGQSIQTYFQSEGYARIFEAYYEVVELQEDDYPEDVPAFGAQSVITIKDLGYKYPGTERYVLSNINLEFLSGEKIAVVGHNGCGKTTLVSILMGVLQSYEGLISVDGIEDRKRVQQLLRGNTSCILQDFCQYQLTVRENIEAGCGGCPLPDEKLTELLGAVGLLEEIRALPQGWDTHLGQLFDGVEVSKGQWQRLAIARLLADENARIWILDEPTAYLDPISEIEIYRLIYSLSEDRLVFFISHRLGFARQADRILMIDDGSLAEEGTHDELMRAGGAYGTMFTAQKAWYETANKAE